MAAVQKTKIRLAISLFLVMLYFSGLPAQAQYGGGTGEPNDPYLIYTAEQMNAIGANRNDWDKHFKLMADVDLSSFTGTDFNIIGRSNRSFKGVFDGNGHRISNFSYISTDTDNIGFFGYIGSQWGFGSWGEKGEIKDLGLIDPNVDAGTGWQVGSLVGYLEDGTIMGCYVEGGSISGSYRVGGLVGVSGDLLSDPGTITDCYSTGSVTGNSYVGGLVGWNKSGNLVTGCYSSGSVTGGSGVGGLAGENSEGTITNCTSSASVSGDDYVGGLIGENSGSIDASYSTGTVSGNGFVGGLVGNNKYGDFGGFGNITMSYSTGTVNGNGFVGGLVGQNEWRGSIATSYSTGEVTGGGWFVGGLVGQNYSGITTSYSTSAVTGDRAVGGLVGWNEFMGFVNGCYSSGSVSGNREVGGLVGESWGEVMDSFWDTQTSGQVTSYGGTGKTTAEMQTASTFLDAGWDFVDETANGTEDVWWILEGQDYPRLWWENKPGEAPDIQQLSDFLTGAGTENDPYLIYTAEQMNEVGLHEEDWDKHFKLMADIELSAYTGTSFNIIGSLYAYFRGVFDGNGHTISNFTYTSTGGAGIGLFGYVGWWTEKGEIKDLGLIDPNVDAETGDYVGSLVGELRNGTITSCYVEGGSVSGNGDVGQLVGSNFGTITTCYSNGVVTGHDDVGGLVGFNNGTITNCYSAGSVSGQIYVGGLVGENSGTITTCYSAGSVKCSSIVGGLVGDNIGTITNCYSTGSVSGYEQVSGLVGLNYGTITNCYSAGSVTGYEWVGGLVGENSWGGAQDSFWDTQTSGQATSDGGEGKTTAEMQTTSTFLDAGWDFVDETANGTEDIWWILEGRDYPRLWWEAAEQ